MESKYFMMFSRATKQAENELTQGKREGIKRAVYAGVRFYNLHDYNGSETNPFKRYETWTVVIDLISLLTPVELIEMFPINKVYDGDRWEVKDYFYTMGEINKLSLKKPLGNAAIDLLMDYENEHLRTFVVNGMCVISGMARFKTGPSLIDQFVRKTKHEGEGEKRRNHLRLVKNE